MCDVGIFEKFVDLLEIFCLERNQFVKIVVVYKQILK
jgi:hypothetical protein